MLNKIKKADQKGFTIIEVMIVLAIAGLIILIVLLAVPALQRNSRNTAIKNDASAVAGGINEFASNNDGDAPTAITGTGTVAITGAAGTTASQAKAQGSTAVSTVAAAPSTPLTAGTIQVLPKKRCDGTVSNRAFAIYYSIETAGASVNKCVDS
jgi:prepilin-type N-terminal cleavage/methylation domain-containing protein